MSRRSLIDRVDKKTAQRLKVVALALTELRVDGRASRIYINEIVECIDSGLLLASIELATTLLELWVRDLLVIHKTKQKGFKNKHELNYLLTKFDREIEGSERGMLFMHMCKELFASKVIDEAERDWLASVYKKQRTPMHHGLTGRLVDPEGRGASLLLSASTKEEMFLASMLSSAPHRRADELEDMVYSSAADTLEGILNFIAAHQIPSVGL